MQTHTCTSRSSQLPAAPKPYISFSMGCSTQRSRSKRCCSRALCCCSVSPSRKPSAQGLGEHPGRHELGVKPCCRDRYFSTHPAPASGNGEAAREWLGRRINKSRRVKDIRQKESSASALQSTTGAPAPQDLSMGPLVPSGSRECHYSLSHPVSPGSPSLSPSPPPWSRLDLSSRHTLKATSSASASINLIP